MYAYDAPFMAVSHRSSMASAKKIIRVLLSELPIESVLDVGCGTGAWLNEWRTSGASVHGIDGAYARQTLNLGENEFTSVDLAAPVSLGRKWDLVQSLEVAEHLPPGAAINFVRTLTEHSLGLVLFSAAPPGQGGENHINERPLNYWRSLFAAEGYVACDFVRPRIAAEKEISFWYRFNTVLYIKESRLEEVSATVRASVTANLIDISPLAFKARKLAVNLIPRSVQDRIAQAKARL